MQKPLVSVICLCYNHERYVAEALLSVLNQTYENIELIVVDDSSTDDSTQVIQKIITDLDITFIQLERNLGNCKAFNKGFEAAKGKYIIDLSADDVLIKNRVELGVEAFSAHSKDFGVQFTDAFYIDEYSNIIKYHYERDQYGSLVQSIPEGNVYRHLLEKYFICTPTMMFKREVLEALGGYNEELAYEDFDFWVRSSRNFKYIYTDEILVKKRYLPDSMASKQYFDEKFLESTLKVCTIAKDLNDNEEENKALRSRIRYEMRQAMLYGHYSAASDFYSLYKELKPGVIYRLLFWIGLKLKLNLTFLTQLQER